MTARQKYSSEDDANHFPWIQFMMVAMRSLGWSPEVFWRSSPAELQAFAACLQPTANVFDRATFEDLQQIFPDEPRQEHANEIKEVE